jgi:hypothetical protein
MKSTLSKIGLLVALLVLASTALAKVEKTTMKGYLLDKMCSNKILKDKDAKEATRKHSVECAEECAKGGYGILSNGKYYLFDQKGNDMVATLLKSTKKKDSLSIEVMGTVKGDKIDVESLKESE